MMDALPVHRHSEESGEPPRTSGRAFSRRLAPLLVTVSALLSSCASGPEVPDWSISAIGHVERFTEAYLKGDTRIEAREYALARAETARTGRPDLVARIELNRCAARVASLVFESCEGFEPLRADASEAERAYADYLSGKANQSGLAKLPAHHRAVAAGGTSLSGIEDPFSRLVAAGVVMRRGDATPDTVTTAVDTASRQGWRRPLLAWLGVQARLAEERGDPDDAARIRRRMGLVQP